MSIRLAGLDPNDPQRIALGIRRQFTTTITVAQLLALFATPRVIVPAPGGGKWLRFDGAELYMRYGGTLYTVPGTSELAVKYTGAAGLQVGQGETTGFLDQATNQRRYIQPYRAAAAASDITPVVNAPLVLQMLVAEVTVGNSPLLVRTNYFVQEALS